MQAIENAWRNWFLQFVPFVFPEGEIIDDPTNTLYPRITHSAGIGESLQNTLVTVILWDWGHNSDRLLAIHGMIDKAVPALSGTDLIIPSETYFEYRDPVAGLWKRFELSEFQNLADQFAPNPVEWRRVKSGSDQIISIWRDTTYSQPYPQDERLSRARLIRLHVRNRTSI